MFKKKLAINGGAKIRSRAMPFRCQFGKAELEAVSKVFENSWNEEADFGYQAKYEELYTKSFCDFQGGGYADAVSSGTAAVYLALAALDLKIGSDVIVSPVTDPGSVSPVILQNMNLIIADSEPDSFNIGPEQFEAAITNNTRAAIITHSGGNPCDIEKIIDIADQKEIKVIEDCSQAHGAIYKNKKVGCFGDIGVFSTMFSKNHSTGGTGGVVFTQNENYYWKIRALADRGKPYNDPNFNPKDPTNYLFPALNFNLDELSCAIGLSTLSKLQLTINKRNSIVEKINEALIQSLVVSPVKTLKYCIPSPYFHTLAVDIDKITVTKKQFAESIQAEGISINSHYKYVVCEWHWLKPYIQSQSFTPNAIDFMNKSFNVLFNENYGDDEIKDIIDSILKVESVFVG